MRIIAVIFFLKSLHNFFEAFTKLHYENWTSNIMQEMATNDIMLGLLFLTLALVIFLAKVIKEKFTFTKDEVINQVPVELQVYVKKELEELKIKKTHAA